MSADATPPHLNVFPAFGWLSCVAWFFAVLCVWVAQRACACACQSICPGDAALGVSSPIFSKWFLTLGLLSLRASLVLVCLGSPFGDDFAVRESIFG